MKTKKLLLICLVAFHTIASVEAQGTFQNLGFESASLVALPGDPFGRVQFATAFPGWVGYVGGVQETAALYNNAYLDSSGIGIIDSGWPHYFGPTGGVISGSFTAMLQAGVIGGLDSPADATLSQTGLVPSDAQSLRFRVYSPSFAPIGVFLGSQRLTLTALASGTNYTVFGADISTWQGQMAQLDFTAFAGRPHINNNNFFLDSIQFSNQPIPEPSTFCLFGLGALLLGWRFMGKQP